MKRTQTLALISFVLTGCAGATPAVKFTGSEAAQTTEAIRIENPDFKKGSFTGTEMAGMPKAISKQRKAKKASSVWTGQECVGTDSAEQAPEAAATTAP